MEEKKPTAVVSFTKYADEEEGFQAEIKGDIVSIGHLLANGLVSLMQREDPVDAAFFRRTIELALEFIDDEHSEKIEDNKEDNTDE